MNNRKPHLTKGFWVFVSVMGFAVLANVASYFWLSSGFGIRQVKDGLVRFGFPFLVFERGGIDGRDEFYWRAALLNLLIALSCAFAAGLLTYFMMRKSAKTPEE